MEPQKLEALKFPVMGPVFPAAGKQGQEVRVELRVGGPGGLRRKEAQSKSGEMTALHVSFPGKMKDSADAHGQELKERLVSPGVVEPESSRIEKREQKKKR